MSDEPPEITENRHYIKELLDRVEKIEKQIEKGFCPNCGHGLEKDPEAVPVGHPLKDNYVRCPQCTNAYVRKDV